MKGRISCILIYGRQAPGDGTIPVQRKERACPGRSGNKVLADTHEMID